MNNIEIQVWKTLAEQGLGKETAHEIHADVLEDIVADLEATGVDGEQTQNAETDIKMFTTDVGSARGADATPATNTDTGAESLKIFGGDD